MKYPHIDPVLIHFGPFAVRWYGLMYVVGFLLGYFLLLKFSQREQYD
ncbi:MAG: prolipoprotein diacylglyceryl transferase, partial [Deltaproteobacteria bacterium]